MKRTTWTFGIIAGIITTTWIIAFIAMSNSIIDFEHGELLGYSAMILAFSFIFVAVKQYRDKLNGGIVTFGKAFRLGLYISLIASTFYVTSWLIGYYLFIPDFMDQYASHMIAKSKAAGATDAQISAQMTEMAGYKEMYQNPFFNAAFTYMEILPVGLVVSLICAAVLKKRAVTAAGT